MKLSTQLAKHLRGVYFGGNWSDSNLKDQLTDVTWQQATMKIYDLNTIAVIFNHIHYYVRGVTKVLEGGPLDIRDKFSFDHPPIESPEDWEAILTTAWTEAAHFAQLIEELPEERFSQVFTEEKYGQYFGNLVGIIEHLHYHLGQIVVVKKILNQTQSAFI